MGTRHLRLTDFTVLTFGCYGTLIDKDFGVYTALRPLLGKGGIALGRDEVMAAFARHETAHRKEAPETPYSETLTEVHRRLAAEWHVIAQEDDHLLFGKSIHHWPAFADTPAALQYLRRYFKLLIISNGDRDSLAASRRRLEVRFDAIYAAQDFGIYKPNPKVFQYMMEHLASLGLDNRSTLHVAQSLAQDHGPANSIGLASAWIDRRRVTEKRSVTIQLPDAVRYDFRFPSLADMVKAHQEQLRI